MRFKKFYQINELFNNWYYYVPKDKKHLLFDFYALSLIYPKDLNDIDMMIAFKEAKETISIDRNESSPSRRRCIQSF